MTVGLILFILRYDLVFLLNTFFESVLFDWFSLSCHCTLVGDNFISFN